MLGIAPWAPCTLGKPRLPSELYPAPPTPSLRILMPWKTGCGAKMGWVIILILTLGSFVVLGKWLILSGLVLLTSL